MSSPSWASRAPKAIALGVEGVTVVRNDLLIKRYPPDSQPAGDESFTTGNLNPGEPI